VSPLRISSDLSGAPGFQRQLRDVYEEYTLDTPQYYKGWWKSMYDTKAYEELFAPAIHEVSEWSVGMTADQVNHASSNADNRSLTGSFPSRT
jgi:hypothetical protein